MDFPLVSRDLRHQPRTDQRTLVVVHEKESCLSHCPEVWLSELSSVVHNLASFLDLSDGPVRSPGECWKVSFLDLKLDECVKHHDQDGVLLPFGCVGANLTQPGVSSAPQTALISWRSYSIADILLPSRKPFQSQTVNPIASERVGLLNPRERNAFVAIGSVQ